MTEEIKKTEKQEEIKKTEQEITEQELDSVSGGSKFTIANKNVPTPPSREH